MESIVKIIKNKTINYLESKVDNTFTQEDLELLKKDINNLIYVTYRETKRKIKKRYRIYNR